MCLSTLPRGSQERSPARSTEKRNPLSPCATKTRERAAGANSAARRGRPEEKRAHDFARWRPAKRGITDSSARPRGGEPAAAAAFPRALLLRCVTASLSPPRSTRAAVLSLYRDLDSKQLRFERAPAPAAMYRSGYFCLSLLHGSLLERRRFGVLGFNAPYDFDAVDWQCCVRAIEEALLSAPSPVTVGTKLKLTLPPESAFGKAGGTTGAGIAVPPATTVYYELRVRALASAASGMV